MTEQEKRLLLVTGVVGVGGGLGYWLYLYLQDPENAPSASDMFENIKSYFSRAYDIISGAAGDVTGTSTYLDKATALVARLETFSAKAYYDRGHLAIGYGHDVQPGEPYTIDSRIPESEGSALLKIDLQSADNCIASTIQVSLNDNQRAALLSFIYNVGCGAFQSSTMLRDINAGDFAGAADQFNAWIYSRNPQTNQEEVLQALVDRREQEQALFVS
jgi:lysozyme